MILLILLLQNPSSFVHTRGVCVLPGTLVSSLVSSLIIIKHDASVSACKRVFECVCVCVFTNSSFSFILLTIGHVIPSFSHTHTHGSLFARSFLPSFHSLQNSLLREMVDSMTMMTALSLSSVMRTRLSAVNNAAAQALMRTKAKDRDTDVRTRACQMHRDAFGAVYLAPGAAAKHGLLLRFNARGHSLRSVLGHHDNEEEQDDEEQQQQQQQQRGVARDTEEDVECRSILPSVLARRGTTTTTRSGSFASPDIPTRGMDDDDDDDNDESMMDRRRVRMLVSRYGETCCLEREGKLVVVSMHSPLRTVENLLLGDEGDTAEVCPSTTVSARGSPARAVMHMSFHPDSASHLCLLMDGNVFLIYNVAENARSPEQAFELRARADIVSFCFPASTSQHVSGWTRFAVLFIDVHGGIASLCPVLPGGIKMVSHLVPSVSDADENDDDDDDDDDDMGHEDEGGDGFGRVRGGDRYAACCKSWVAARFPELWYRHDGMRKGGSTNGGAGIASGLGDRNGASKMDARTGRPTSVLVSRPAREAAACVPMLYALPMTGDDADGPPSRSYSRLRRIHYVKVSEATGGSGSGDTGIGVVVSACYFTGTIRVYLVFPDLKPVWDFAPDVCRRGAGAGAGAGVHHSLDVGPTIIRLATEESCSRSVDGDDACVGPPRRQTQELVLVDAKSIGDARSGGIGEAGMVSSISLLSSVSSDAPFHDAGARGILDIAWNYTDNTRLLLVRDVDVHVLTLSLLSTLTALGVHGGSDMQIGEDIRVPSCVIDRIYSARDSGCGRVTGAIMTGGDVLCVTDVGEVLSSPLPVNSGLGVGEDDDAQLTRTPSTSDHGGIGCDDNDDDSETELALRALVADFNAKVNSGGGGGGAGATRSPISSSSSDSATTLEFSPPPKLLNTLMSSKTPADSVEGQKLLASSLRDFRSRYLGYAHRVHAALRARMKHQEGASEKNANLAEDLAKRIAKLKRGDTGGGCTSQALQDRVLAIRDLHDENSALLRSLKDTAAEAASGSMLRRENSVGEKILIENLGQLEDQIIPHLRERLAAFSASLDERSAEEARQKRSATRHHVAEHATSKKILLSDATMWKVREALASNDTIVRANVADVESLNQTSRM